MNPIQITAIKAFKDNYIWAIARQNSTTTWVVDPGDAKPVLDFLQENQLKLSGILITHHHWDHCNGIKELIARYDVPVYGPQKETILANKVVDERDEIFLSDLQINFQVLAIPGHTLDHIAYYSKEFNILFCGDTLFSAGCGRLFEGTPEQMYSSLMKIFALPEETQIYCAHEYTATNLKFALQIEPENLNLLKRVKEVDEMREKKLPSLPSTLALEKKINPFLRCSTENIITTAQTHIKHTLKNPVDVFAVIRKWKDNFQG